MERFFAVQILRTVSLLGGRRRGGRRKLRRGDEKGTVAATTSVFGSCLPNTKARESHRMMRRFKKKGKWKKTPARKNQLKLLRRRRPCPKRRHYPETHQSLPAEEGGRREGNRQVAPLLQRPVELVCCGSRIRGRRRKKRGQKKKRNSKGGGRGATVLSVVLQFQS